MNLNEYSEKALSTADYPNKGDGLEIIPVHSDDIPKYKLSWNFMYPVTKLAGEAGEFSEKVGKIIRDFDRVLDEGMKFELLKELGDALWYVNCAANELGSSLEEVAQINLTKLKDRAKRGKLHGSGDNR